MATPRLVIELDTSAVDKGAVKARKALADLGVSAEVYERAIDKAKREGDRFANSIRKIEARLDPAARATQAYERTVKQLDEGLRRNVLTQERHAQLMQKAHAHYSTGARGAGQLGGSLADLSSRYLSGAAALAVVTGALATFRAALGRTISEAAGAQQVFVQINAALESTKGISGQTFASLRGIANELQRTSTYGDDAVLKMQSVLLTFTQIRGDNFKAASQAVLDLSARLGTDLQSSAIQVGKALQDPILGLTSLSRAGIQFSDDQKKVIRSLVEGGEAAEAQRIILAELDRQFGGSAAAARDTFKGALEALNNAIGDIFEAVGEGMLPALQNLADTFVDLAQRDETIRAFEAVGRSIGSVAEIVVNAIARFVTFRNTVAEFFAGMDPRLTALMFGGGDTRTRQTVAPLERYRPPEASGGLTDAAMDAALRASVAGLEGAAAAGKKYAASLAEIAKLEKSIADHRAAIDFAEWELSFLPANENFQADINALQTMEVKVDALDMTTRSLMDAAFNTNEAFAKLGEQHGVEELEATIKEINAEWEEFESQVSENFLRGVQSSLSSFFYEVMDGGEDALKNFGKALKELLFKTLAEYLAQWAITQMKMLALSLKRIAAEAAAQKAANAAVGGSATTSAAPAVSTASTAPALSGAAIGGLAFAAVAIAALAVMKHQSDQRDKRRYGTNVSMRTEDGAFYGYMGGRLQETGGKMRDAMVQLAAELQDSTRVLLDGTNNAVISIRNDKKSFTAKLNGELIGIFRSAEEAVIAVIKTQFLRQESLDPVIRQVMENYRGKDPEELAANVRYVQEIIDAVSGLTEMETTLQKLPAQIAAMVGNLKQMGVAMADAQVLAGRWGVQQFQGAWDQISGKQRTPKEEMAMRERQRDLLLAQMALEKARLATEINTLKARMKIAAAGTQFQQRDLAARIHLVKWEANALRNGLDIYGNYVNGRAQLAQIEAGVYDEQLKAMELVMQELDKLMGEVERGKISLGGGKGKGGVEDVIPKATGSGGGWHQRLLSAVETIRDAQKRLVFGELSPFTGREKVTAAQSEVERLRAQYALGGRNKILAMEELPEAVERYLELFKGTYGSSGAYEDIARAMNDMYSSILTQHGVAPVTVMQEQARANADAMGRIFSRDNRGKLHTRNEELERELVVMKRDGDETKRNTSIMVESLSRIEQNTRNTGTTGAVSAPPRALLERAG